MAKTIKTIEYAFQTSNTSLAAATRRDLAAITIYIPETQSRVFRSVYVQVYNKDNVTVAASQTAPLIGVKLGAASFSDITVGAAPGNSGENHSYIYYRDATAYFNTNFGTGTSQTCQVGFSFSGTATINISVKLFITYEYDDTGQSTLIKTVRIPLESGTGALTATLTEIGTNQIPALDTFLPETSKTYRNIFFELVYNDFTVGTVNDSILGMQVDTGTEHTAGLTESALASANPGIYHWDQGASPVWSTASAHAFKLRASTVTTASTFNHIGVILYVTYEYAASSSTIINSEVLLMPRILSAVTARARRGIDYLINEPGTITLVQSGALVSYSQVGAVNPGIQFGTQSSRSYTDVALTYTGTTFLTQRIDSGSAQGAAYTLGRGVNQLYWGYTGTDNYTPNQISATLYLNYTSGKNPDGERCHNHSVHYGFVETQGNSVGTTPMNLPQKIFIPDNEWYRNNLGFVLNGNVNLTSTTLPNWTYVETENQTSELLGSGWTPLYEGGLTNDGEMGLYFVTENLSDNGLDAWQRWKRDHEPRRILETPRRYRILSYPQSSKFFGMWLTYNSNIYVVSGTVTGSDGGNVLLSVYTHSGELVSTGTVTGNSAFYLPVYDPAKAYFVEGRESATKMGRSDNNKVS